MWYLGLSTKNIVFFIVSCVLQNVLLIIWFCVQLRLEKAAQFTTSFLDICTMNIASEEVKKNFVLNEYFPVSFDHNILSTFKKNNNNKPRTL